MALSPKDRRLVRLSAAVVLGRWDAVRAERRAAGPGEPDRAWREALLQTYLFAGFPRVVEAFAVLEEEGGLGRPREGEATGEPGRPDRGRALFERIYGEGAETVRAALAGYHPDLARWIEEHAYGRVLTRPGLPAARRELLAVACLAALGQERQLASHLRGGLRCGASPAQLRAAIEAVADLVGDAATARALRCADQYAPAPGRRPEPRESGPAAD